MDAKAAYDADAIMHGSEMLRPSRQVASSQHQHTPSRQRHLPAGHRRLIHTMPRGATAIKVLLTPALDVRNSTRRIFGQSSHCPSLSHLALRITLSTLLQIRCIDPRQALPWRANQQLHANTRGMAMCIARSTRASGRLQLTRYVGFGVIDFLGSSYNRSPSTANPILHYDGRSYELFRTATFWYKASLMAQSMTCSGQPGHLAALETRDEYEVSMRRLVLHTQWERW